MSEHGSATEQLRLGVVAALIADTGPAPPGTGPADGAAIDELPLAEALRGPAGQPDEAARPSPSCSGWPTAPPPPGFWPSACGRLS